MTTEAITFYAVEYTPTYDSKTRLSYYGRHEADALTVYDECKAKPECFLLVVVATTGDKHTRLRRYSRDGQRVVESNAHVPVIY